LAVCRDPHLGRGPVRADRSRNDSTYLGAQGAIVSGQGKNQYAFTGRATHVTIKNLTIENFGKGSSSTTPSSDDNNEGVVNHDAGHDWTIENNTIRHLRLGGKNRRLWLHRGGKFWRTHGATFDNYVHDNYSVGMWADTDNNAFDVEGNYFANNSGEGIEALAAHLAAYPANGERCIFQNAEGLAYQAHTYQQRPTASDAAR
jgi:hypothetical protein